MSEQGDSINISDDTEGHVRAKLEDEQIPGTLGEDEARGGLDEDDTEDHTRIK